MLTEAFRVWGVYFGFFTVSVSLCTVWPCNEFAGTATPGKNNSCFKCVQRFWQQTATTYSEDQIILKKYIFLICKNILLEKGILSCVICLVSLLLHVAAAKFWAHIDMHKKLTFEIRQRFAFACFFWFFLGGGVDALLCTCMTSMLIVHEAQSAFSRLSAVWATGMLFAYSGFLLVDDEKFLL